MKKIIIIIFSALLVSFQCAVCVCSAASEPEEFVVSGQSSLYKEVMPLAVAWKNAVIARDSHGFDSNLLPENILATKEALKNTRSRLYRYLYDNAYVKKKVVNGKSVYEHLHGAQDLQIVLIGKEPVSVFGVTAIFYDAKNSKLKFPINDQDKIKYWMVKYVECGFLEVDGEWRVVFETQFEE